jgi:hypothetical protein
MDLHTTCCHLIGHEGEDSMLSLLKHICHCTCVRVVPCAAQPRSVLTHSHTLSHKDAHTFTVTHSFTCMHAHSHTQPCSHLCHVTSMCTRECKARLMMGGRLCFVLPHCCVFLSLSHSIYIYICPHLFIYLCVCVRVYMELQPIDGISFRFGETVDVMHEASRIAGPH